MPVGLTSPHRSRERIMIYGHEGTGKSTDALSIARKVTGTVYVVDNDNSYDRLLETYDTELPNVKIAGVEFAEGHDPYAWDGMQQAINEAISQMERDDWLVVDMLSKAWDSVQEWFIEQIFQSDIDDYFLKVRLQKEMLRASQKKAGEKEDKALGVFEGWMDWPVINQTYHKRISTPLLRCPGHLLCVSEAQPLQKEDDQGIRDLYGPVGARPKGQKRSGHIMQTVIMQTKESRADVFKLTGVKDRGRVLWRGEVMGDFAEDYLGGVGGWQRTFIR